MTHLRRMSADPPHDTSATHPPTWPKPTLHGVYDYTYTATKDLPEDTSTCGQRETGFEPPTLQPSICSLLYQLSHNCTVKVVTEI